MSAFSVSVALFVLRLVLAALLAWSGVAKLADREGFREALAGFALPAGLARPAAVVLPIAELAVAAALVPAATSWWAAVAALFLLLAFTLVLVVTLIRGQRPECHCFGAFSSRPISWMTVARNGILATAAAVLVAPGPGASRPGPVAAAGRLSAAELAGLAAAIVLSAVVVTQGWLIVHLLRQHGRMLVRLDALEAERPGRDGRSRPTSAASSPNGHTQGLAIGIPAPEFRLPALDGPVTSLRDLLAAGQPVALTFVDPRCGPCTELLPELARWHRDHASRLSMAVISTGTAEANHQTADRYGAGLVLLQQDREISDAYAVYGTPGMVLVGVDGRISSHAAAGRTAIYELLAAAAAEQIPADSATGHPPGVNGHRPLPYPAWRPPADRIGSPAPPVRLFDPSGKPVDLAGYRGHPTLLLFWNPACGFCQKMLGDLQRWEAGRTQEAPQLLVVSTGTPEANQALGLASSVLLDTGFNTGTAFGASGTPSAVLIDKDGRIASELAVGAPGVLALAGHTAIHRDASPLLPGRFNDAYLESTEPAR